jgi:hypothetical protein
MAGEPVLCVAQMDCVAKTGGELSFNKNDEILLIKKLGNGFYIGALQENQGIFRGKMVQFQRRNKDDASTVKGQMTLESTCASMGIHARFMGATKQRTQRGFERVFA